MKKRIWIGSMVLISTLFCSYFAFDINLGNRGIKAQSFKIEETIPSNKAETISDLVDVDFNNEDRYDMLKENGCFVSEKTVVEKEELKQSQGVLRFADRVVWEEYQKYQESKKRTEDYNSEYRYGARFLDEKSELLMPDKVIVIEGYQDVCIEGICNNWLTASFLVSSEKPELSESEDLQRGLLIYDIEKEAVLTSILPEDSRFHVGSSVVTENYLYWCEENSLDDQSVWEVKGMDLNTQRAFCICKSEEFKTGCVPSIGSCREDDLYFYFEYPQKSIGQDTGYNGFGLVRDTAYQLDLMCYQPEKDSLDKKAEFYFRYDYCAKPCIEGDFVYTVEYDGEDWYILCYDLLSDTYCHYRMKLEYRTEYIQELYACPGYIIYKTSFGRRFLFDLNTLEVREFTDWVSWRGIAGGNLFFRKIYEKEGWDYCYNLAENRYYKLVQREDKKDGIFGSDREWGIFDKNENKIYLYR